MALRPNELFSPSAGPTATRTVVRESAVKQFAPGTGTLPVNCPVTINTSTGFWEEWISGGANGTGVLKGVLFPDALDFHATSESLATVLIRGIVHAEDIRTASSEADADVNTILQTQARDLGIDVQGLVQVR